MNDNNPNLNNIKELAVNEYSNTTTWLTHSQPLCAILAYPKLIPWAYQNYINIASHKHIHGYLRVDYSRYPYKEILSDNFISYDDFHKLNINIIDFIIDKLEANSYLIVYIDEGRLPQHDGYNKKHKVHETMIYGYDNEANSLMALSFDKRMIFKKLSYNYGEFSDAFMHGSIYYKETAPWAENKAVRFFTINHSKGDYKFDIEKFIIELEKYVYAKEDPPNDEYVIQYGKEFEYGINVYNSILDTLQNNSQDYLIDYRGFHFIYEHKIGIFERLEYIKRTLLDNDQFENLVQGYKTIVNYADKIRNSYSKLALKESMGKSYLRPIKDSNSIIKISSMIRELREQELNTLLNILEEIKKY